MEKKQTSIGLIEAPNPRAISLDERFPAARDLEPFSFEAAQEFLQRVSAQLSVGDQSDQESADIVAELTAEIDLMSYEKALMWDWPIHEDVKERVEHMNPRTLRKMENLLSIRPRGLAVRFIHFVHTSLGTDAPNPLPLWLEEMESQILDRYKNYPVRRVYRAFERGLYTCTMLYASALLEWIEAFAATLALDTAAGAYADRGLPLDEQLSRRLLEQDHRLRVWAAVMRIIEEEHLRASVLPDDWRALLDPDRLGFRTADSPTKPAGGGTHTLESAPIVEEARANVNALLATAFATADITRCYNLLFRFAEARLTLANRLGEWQKLRDLQAQKPASPPRISRRSKPRRSPRRATSATQRDQAKTGRMKQITL